MQYKLKVSREEKCSLRKEFENAVELWQDNYLLKSVTFLSNTFSLISFSTLCVVKITQPGILCTAKISKPGAERNSYTHISEGEEDIASFVTQSFTHRVILQVDPKLEVDPKPSNRQKMIGFGRGKRLPIGPPMMGPPV